MKVAEQRVFHLLLLAAQRLRTVADQASLAEAGITAAQAAVLMVIAGAPGIRQCDIASTLRQRESAITAMVRRLLAAGLVGRFRHESDGRTWSLELTSKGELAIEAMSNPLNHINERLSKAIGDDNIDAFVTALRVIGEFTLQDDAASIGARASTKPL
jgi:MarR family transcriptional regulator, organic hydroperoxide resistance regulator